METDRRKYDRTPESLSNFSRSPELGDITSPENPDISSLYREMQALLHAPPREIFAQEASHLLSCIERFGSPSNLVRSSIDMTLVPLSLHPELGVCISRYYTAHFIWNGAFDIDAGRAALSESLRAVFSLSPQPEAIAEQLAPFVSYARSKCIELNLDPRFFGSMLESICDVILTSPGIGCVLGDELSGDLAALFEASLVAYAADNEKDHPFPAASLLKAAAQIALEKDGNFPAEAMLAHVMEQPELALTVSECSHALGIEIAGRVLDCLTESTREICSKLKDDEAYFRYRPAVQYRLQAIRKLFEDRFDYAGLQSILEGLCDAAACPALRVDVKAFIGSNAVPKPEDASLRIHAGGVEVSLGGPPDTSRYDRRFGPPSPDEALRGLKDISNLQRKEDAFWEKAGDQALLLLGQDSSDGRLMERLAQEILDEEFPHPQNFLRRSLLQLQRMQNIYPDACSKSARVFFRILMKTLASGGENALNIAFYTQNPLFTKEEQFELLRSSIALHRTVYSLRDLKNESAPSAFGRHAREDFHYRAILFYSLWRHIEAEEVESLPPETVQRFLEVIGPDKLPTAETYAKRQEKRLVKWAAEWQITEARVRDILEDGSTPL